MDEREAIDMEIDGAIEYLEAERDAARADAERLAKAIRDWWDSPGDGNADDIRAALTEHDALAAREAR